MLPYFVLGIAIVAGLLLAGRWYSTADPKTLIKVLKWLLLGIIGSVALFFLATGRLAWALFALPALLPWFMRARSMARMAKTFSRMTSGSGPRGETSDVETRFLRMTLDHDSGAMSGEVTDGPYAGRRIEDMTEPEIVDLLRTCWTEDQQSAQVLEAYLDRIHPGWRDHADAAGGTGEGARRSDIMDRAEALDILGLEDGASEADIKEAHKRLIAGSHPDHGGSTYLAAKINQAKDFLLG